MEMTVSDIHGVRVVEGVQGVISGLNEGYDGTVARAVNREQQTGLDHVGKAFFRSAEVPDADQQEEQNNYQ
jgi:hypothetical protein